MSFRLLFKSISYAVRGLATLWRSEQNFRIQSVVGFVVIISSWLLPFGLWERILLVLLVALVLILEAINSVFERLFDVVKSRLHPSVRDMKDMMAAAVLISSLVVLSVGLWLFYPRLLFLFIRM